MRERDLPERTSKRERCATHALGDKGEYYGLSIADLLATENGHHFHGGWHVGWAWNPEGDDEYLDFLTEHRMTSIDARRLFPDGSVEWLETPQGMRIMGDTPEEDARLEREYFEHNRRAYAALRARGLLPDHGKNLGSQDINEYLTSGFAADT